MILTRPTNLVPRFLALKVARHCQQSQMMLIVHMKYQVLVITPPTDQSFPSQLNETLNLTHKNEATRRPWKSCNCRSRAWSVLHFAGVSGLTIRPICWRWSRNCPKQTLAWTSETPNVLDVLNGCSKHTLYNYQGTEAKYDKVDRMSTASYRVSALHPPDTE